MVQRLRLPAPSAETLGLIPGRGTGSHMQQLSIHMPQLKILHAATERSHAATERSLAATEDPACRN